LAKAKREGRKKPADRRQGHRSTQKVVDLKPVVGFKPPRPPANLLKSSRERWAAFWKTDISRAVEESDFYALRRWIEAVDERERLAPVIRKSPTVPGSMGQPVLNPLGRRLTELEKQIEGFERQFGMTPKGRADLGIATGHAAMTAAQLNEMANADTDQEDQEAIEGEAKEITQGFSEA
jgi:P27 family predicted phage terminase small subunit